MFIKYWLVFGCIYVHENNERMFYKLCTALAEKDLKVLRLKVEEKEEKK